VFKQKEFVYLKLDAKRSEEVVFLANLDEEISIVLQVVKEKQEDSYMNVSFVGTDELSKKPATEHVDTFDTYGFSREQVLEIISKEYLIQSGVMK
jgi:hypothetical protein